MSGYGYSFTWKVKNGSTTIEGQGFETQKEAISAMWFALYAFGYRPPRWFEFWRWQETTPQKIP